MSILNTTTATFEQDVIEASKSKPILLDHHASWCGPCKMMNPILEKLNDEQDKLDVVKVDVDANPEIASKFGVVSIPTMLVIVNGEVVKTLVGAMPLPRLNAELSEYLA
jgi:thioredoxin 1